MNCKLFGNSMNMQRCMADHLIALLQPDSLRLAHLLDVGLVPDQCSDIADPVPKPSAPVALGSVNLLDHCRSL